ncbi:hypothetical protein E2C01_085416 [Portunus trituberculatus]|uniref:Uncharacterized protein n=1 Tax=Portunus trituberculatus TaxID=210409 RepID=A0A5B7JBU9_PORTR|nr:hypothetical protein [Portunus trituberculatus]
MWRSRLTWSAAFIQRRPPAPSPPYVMLLAATATPLPRGLCGSLTIFPLMSLGASNMR